MLSIMENSQPSFDWKADWFQYWVWGPIAAYYLSWTTGFLSVLLFPILLTIAQFMSFKKNPFISKPRRWFYWLIPALYVWSKFGPIPPHSGSFGVAQGVLNYYMGQSVATAVLMFMTDSRLLHYWILGNLLAALLWFGCYYVAFLLDAPKWLSANSGFAIYLFFPVISVLSNAVTGYFLYLSTKPSQYERA